MAEFYDYLEAVKDDVREYVKLDIDVKDFEDRDELEEHLNDVLWADDSVTGNGSGSYTFSTWQAEENLSHNWDILADALEEFGSGTDVLRQGAEACDVIIRCYYLSQAISEVLDELEDELFAA